LQIAVAQGPGLTVFEGATTGADTGTFAAARLGLAATMSRHLEGERNGRLPKHRP
jgi:hypothetical protein